MKSIFRLIIFYLLGFESKRSTRHVTWQNIWILKYYNLISDSISKRVRPGATCLVFLNAEQDFTSSWFGLILVKLTMANIVWTAKGGLGRVISVETSLCWFGFFASSSIRILFQNERPNLEINFPGTSGRKNGKAQGISDSDQWSVQFIHWILSSNISETSRKPLGYLSDKTHKNTGKTWFSKVKPLGNLSETSRRKPTKTQGKLDFQKCSISENNVFPVFLYVFSERFPRGFREVSERFPRGFALENHVFPVFLWVLSERYPRGFREVSERFCLRTSRLNLYY